MDLAIERSDHALGKLSTLAKEVGSYAQSVKIDTDCCIAPDRDGYLLRSGFDPAPPASWKLTVSEIVHHLRAALDNAAWHLVNMNGPPSNPLDVAFPVVYKAENWQGQACKKLPGVTQEVVDLVETVQPFSDSPGSAQSWLGLLAYLNNKDKHEELIRINPFSFDARHSVEIEYRGELPSADEHIVQVTADVDTIVFFVRTGGYVEHVKGSVEGRAEFILLSPDGHPIKLINGLANLTASVRAMVGALAGHATAASRSV